MKKIKENKHMKQECQKIHLEKKSNNVKNKLIIQKDKKITSNKNQTQILEIKNFKKQIDLTNVII